MRAQQLGERRGLHLAQLGELGGHVGDRAVVLAQLLAGHTTQGDRLGRRSVSLVGQRRGERLGPVRRGGGGRDHGAVPLDHGVHPLPGEVAYRFAPAAVGQEAQRRDGEVVVGVPEPCPAGLGEQEELGRAAAAAEGSGFAELVPVSAVDGFQVGLLADLLLERLPEGPPLYPDGALTDEPELTLVAELIREAALEGVRDELPHSLAVVVEEMVPREGRTDLLDVHANVYVERSSQKAIVIGRGGERLREVGTTARRHIEKLLGNRVYLDLHVKVAKDWQRDPKQLRKLGF